MNSQRVSVIIPVYNSEKFLRESLESVIHQTYTDIEIIVVNDGSTDSSLKILKQYEDKITIINQKNMGLAKAVNAGIRKMSGYWLKWLSPDDILYSNAIEVLVNEAKKLPTNTILYSNWEIINEKGNKLRNFHESNYNNLDDFEFNVRLLDGQQINVNTTLIPFSLIKKGCMIQNLDDTTVIDYDFFLRSGILYGMSFYFVEKILLKYRIHSKQISHKNISKSLTYLDKIRNDVLSNLDEKTRNKYHSSLKSYSSTKRLDKKIMECGLNVITKLLPENISDKMLIFYLNKIRKRR
ncbi:glycosyltransferase [Nitrosopumilus sp.]|uniref:glycosyltransferase n=1 Tax=Nitrosopumilus sp. TaxID=2024843 RepID=UPI00292FC7C5|nr:glycosyltransferase [Nitrosopumilus sp.]